MVNFKKVIMLGLGLLLSINSFGMDHVECEPVREQENSEYSVEKIKSRFLTYYNDGSKSPECKLLSDKQYFEHAEVLKNLPDVMLETINCSGVDRLGGNVLFYILNTNRYGKKNNLNSPIVSYAMKKEMFKFLIELYTKEKTEVKTKALEKIVNGVIVNSSDSTQKDTLFNGIFKKLNNFELCDENNKSDLKEMLNMLFNTNLLKREAIIVGVDNNKSYIKCKLNKLNRDLILNGDSTYVQDLKSLDKYKDFFKEISESKNLKLTADDLKMITQAGIFKKNSSVKDKTETLLMKSIREREFKFVKSVLSIIQPNDFINIKDYDLLLHNVISSVGCADQDKKLSKDQIDAAVELIEFLLLVPDQKTNKSLLVNNRRNDKINKNRSPLLFLSRNLKDSVVHLDKNDDPRRISDKEIANKILRLLLQYGADLGMFDNSSKYSRNFIFWLICEIKKSMRKELLITVFSIAENNNNLIQALGELDKDTWRDLLIFNNSEVKLRDAINKQNDRMKQQLNRLGSVYEGNKYVYLC